MQDACNFGFKYKDCYQEYIVDMNKLITIIVPIYNAEQYLDVCIKSMVEQTYREIEIILIDDGSNDKSRDICESWENRDSRIRYICQENRGAGAARNRGLAEAHGEYISFVDADDYLCDVFCQRMVDVLENKNADIVHCDTILFFEDGSSKIQGKNSQLACTWKSIEYEYCFPKEHFVVWGAMYRRTVLDGLSFLEDMPVGEDTVFFAMAVRNANVMAYYDEALYFYRILEMSLSHGSFDRKRCTQIEAWKRVCEIFDDWPLAKLSAQAQLVETCNNMLGRYLFDKEFDKESYKNIRQIYRSHVWKAVTYHRMKGENPFKCIVKGLFPWLYALYYKRKWLSR